MSKAITLILLSIFCSINNSNSQTKNMNAGGVEIKTSSVDPYLNADYCSSGVLPEFPGGTNKLVAFAKSKIKYPNSAINDNVQGSVILTFYINKQGKVINKKIYKGVRHDLNTVCLHMLNQMPIWKHGTLNGKPIDVRERWTITFVLTD